MTDCKIYIIYLGSLSELCDLGGESEKVCTCRAKVFVPVRGRSTEQLYKYITFNENNHLNSNLPMLPLRGIALIISFFKCCVLFINSST